MSAAAKAKRTLLGIEIPRDELALRIAQGALGMKAPAGTNAKQALDEMDRLFGGDPMRPDLGEGFRLAADQAVLFFHECINAGRQPS
jgi:hypothetical protein